LVISYSEFLCPYCKRQHDQEVFKKLREKYPNDVQTTFRHYIVHQPAKKIAEASECVAEKQGTAGYYNFVDAAFSRNNLSEADLEDIIQEMGMSRSSFKTCFASERYAEKIDAQHAEGRDLFGVNGTPGNIVINLETRERILIPWAYPFEKFDEVVQQLLD